MSKFHVHIYKIIAEIETDIESNSGREAKEAALEWIKYSDDKVPWHLPDCRYMALDFLIRDNPKSSDKVNL